MFLKEDKEEEKVMAWANISSIHKEVNEIKNWENATDTNN